MNHTMDDLSELDRHRIRLEESYRIEVRKELDSSKGSRVFAFLNSNLVIWVLSAVFISAGGFLWQCWQNRQALNEFKERASLEVAYRLSQTLIRLYELSDPNDHRKLAPNHTIQEVNATLDEFVKAPGSRIGQLYPEFSSMNTIGVLAELRRRADQRERVSRSEQIELNGW